MKKETPSNKSIIYYTDNRYLDSPIFPVVQDCILESGLPIVSVSLKPIQFGKNIVLEGRRKGPFTMVLQIITALENSAADYVFFCEHDVLYHKSHFDFTPPRNDVYYYNTNTWRWRYHTDLLVTYDNVTSLSGLCSNRELALNHFRLRKKVIEDQHLDTEMTKETPWSRHMGYEPGFKKRSYFPDEQFEFWKSEFPNIDIRHRFCFSNRKTKISDFNNKPTGWIETTVDKVLGWNLEKMFNL